MGIAFDSDLRCGNCPIRKRAVCAHCDADELAYLEKIKAYRTYAAGQQIQWRGDDLSYVASVVTGVATLSKTLEDGRTQMVGMLLPSDFIGRPGRRTIEFDVTAVTETTLCCFDREPFERLVRDVPHISQRLVEIALDELDAARDWMLLLGRKTAREKIASFLEMLMRRRNATVTQPVEATQLLLPLTREEIANYLGLTLETVSRQLNAFKKEGIVDFHDRKMFTILDPEALRVASGDDKDEPMAI